MNRRDFLRTTVAAASSLLVPTWLIETVKVAPCIDLQAFCATASYWDHRYAMSKPFIQGAGEQLFKFATDGRLCVRIGADESEIPNLPETKAPPANSLPWWKRFDEGNSLWRPWPKADYIAAKDSACDHCGGFGSLAKSPGECPVCFGIGTFINEFGFRYHETDCKACRGCGFAGPYCPTCNGKGIGTFDGVQEIYGGRVFVDARFHAKVAKHLPGAEYIIAEVNEPIRIRFDGGRCLLMPLNPAAARTRIEQA